MTLPVYIAIAIFLWVCMAAYAVKVYKDKTLKNKFFEEVYKLDLYGSCLVAVAGAAVWIVALPLAAILFGLYLIIQVLIKVIK